MSVFVSGGDNGLYWQHFNGTSWSGWRALGGSLTSNPAVTSDSSGMSVFVRGGDNGLYRQLLQRHQAGRLPGTRRV